jgi:hypothetical protein
MAPWPKRGNILIDKDDLGLTCACRYSLTEDASLSHRLRTGALGMPTDDGNLPRPQKASQLRWDRKKKRFIAGDAVGAENRKMLRTESGNSLPATYSSGRFKIWQDRTKRYSSTVGAIHQSRGRIASGPMSKGRLEEKSDSGSRGRKGRNDESPKASRPSSSATKSLLLSADTIRKRRSQSTQVSLIL